MEALRCNRPAWQVHRTMLDSFDFAMVWGLSVKHTPQRCGLAHQLIDEDVIQIVKKRNEHGGETAGDAPWEHPGAGFGVGIGVGVG